MVRYLQTYGMELINGQNRTYTKRIDIINMQK